MTARADILAALRATPQPPRPHPDRDPDAEVFWTRTPDRVRTFETMLGEAGGRVVRVGAGRPLARAWEEHRRSLDARRVFSCVPSLPVAADSELAREPRAMASLDLAVVPASLGVAENGGVWMTESDLPHRGLCLLPEHLAVVLSAASLVDTLHDAYEALQIGERGWGGFLAGPSKTADIEQALVIGAHGPRSLTVLLLEEGLRPSGARG